MQSYSIDEWAALHRISRAMFYKLQKQGKAPQTFNIGVTVRITEAANAEWLAAQTNQAAA
jgi:predicted DNA-binding transcriptional regulator AlpA